MDDFAELALEGVPIVTEHYDKVYDPLKEKTKQGIHKVKEMRERRRGGGYESETESDYEEVDRYGPPPRSQTDPRDRFKPRDDNRRRSRGGEILDEKYTYSKTSGRAKSIGHGRDRYRKGCTITRTRLDHHANRCIGSRRNYSDSESSLSPPRRERRKSLGEKALAALGLTGATGLAIDKERKERARRRSRSRSRPRRDRTPSSDSEGYYVRKKDRSRGYPPPPSSSAAGYRDDRTPARYKPSGYIENGDHGSDGGNNSQVARRNNKSEVSSQRNGSRSGKKDNKDGSKSSESSSSEVCSSSEDERRTKKMKGKEYLTGALAAVATIHAAHSVYNSMEARDKRHKEVEEGKMSAEEARKKKNKARLQDAAAIGIAALGIKSAYSEWQEVQENRQELAEAQEERKKNHEKRMRKLEKYGCLKPGDKEKEKAYAGQRTRSEGGGRRRERSYSR